MAERAGGVVGDDGKRDGEARMAAIENIQHLSQKRA